MFWLRCKKIWYISVVSGVLREMRLSCITCKQESETLAANQHMTVRFTPLLTNTIFTLLYKYN